MNRLEAMIYDKIEAYPNLRVPIVAAYQRLCTCMPRKNYIWADGLKIFPGLFFGFHFRTPWDQGGKCLLAHRIRSDIPLDVAEQRPLEIGMVQEGEADTFTPLATTRAWNWQQGAMLQWVGQTGDLIFNDIIRDYCVSRLLATDGTELACYPLPVGDINADGTYALSFSFSKLGECAPEYGYREILRGPAKLGDAAGEGLWLLPLKGGSPERLFDLRELAAAAPQESMQESKHFFTHCLFSPDGKKFAFFHRWVNPKGTLFTRFHVSDLKGRQLVTLPVSSASHIAWQDDENILAYCVPLGGQRGYHLFNSTYAAHHPLGESFFTSDGHPQFLKGTDYFVTDTYPDKYRIQRLYLYEVQKKRGLELARLKIPFSFRYGRRCDFHPRWSPDGKKICFDSGHSGVRSLCILPLNAI